GLVQLLDRVDHADRRTLIGAKETLDVWIGLDHGLGEVCGLELITTAVLRADDLDVGILGLHLLQEAIPAVDAGAAGLVMDNEADLPGASDRFRQLVRGLPC